MGITALSRVIEQSIGLPPVTPSAMPVVDKPGHIKVRLTFLTLEPKHYRSHQLETQYGFQGPFTEEAYVLMPAALVTSMELITFRTAFAFLQNNFAISRGAKLVSATLLDEDTTTLAYVCK